MAGGHDEELGSTVDPKVEEEWRLAGRSDLGNVFGIVIAVPDHGQDDQGNWHYGLRTAYGIPNRELELEFESEMRGLFTGLTSDAVSRGMLTKEEAEKLRVHPYSVGPAAQEWPKLFFELYQNTRPFLSDGASLLQWGGFVLYVINKLRSWASQKEREQSMAPESSATSCSGASVMPPLVFTRPAIAALCYVDLVQRHAVTADVTLDTFPRSYTEFATDDHPAGNESYLIRAKTGNRAFFYHVSGAGEVGEHYLLIGSKLSLLQLPNFIEEGDTYSPRQPLPSKRIKIKAAKWTNS